MAMRCTEPNSIRRLRPVCRVQQAGAGKRNTNHSRVRHRDCEVRARAPQIAQPLQPAYGDHRRGFISAGRVVPQVRRPCIQGLRRQRVPATTFPAAEAHLLKLLRQSGACGGRRAPAPVRGSATGDWCRSERRAPAAEFARAPDAPCARRRAARPPNPAGRSSGPRHRGVLDGGRGKMLHHCCGLDAASPAARKASSDTCWTAPRQSPV